MTLHVFTPQHDMALAANQRQFTSPKAGRQLAEELDWLPSLWAEDGDAVLVHDLQRAQTAIQGLKGWARDVLWLTPHQLAGRAITSVKPWGWDRSIVNDLRRWGVPSHVLPTEDTLDVIREISHRRWASEHLLPMLRSIESSVIGESSYHEVLPTWHSPVVLKSPWSCSGRGVRYALDATQWERQQTWVSQVIMRQGGIMVEPYYHKVCDFAMEFDSTEEGIIYRGLSLFHTHHGGYTGNIIASERWKLDQLSRYVSSTLLDKIKCAICEYILPFLRLIYTGPFGIDMMVVEDKGQYLLHPCVELNLRRTMGHVALSLAERATNMPRLMAIEYNGHYNFKNYLITNDNDKENVFPRDMYRPDDDAGAKLQVVGMVS